MKIITRNTDYAIRAISFIAKEKKGRVSVSELVKSLKIPRPFLRKIMQVLNKGGLLKSYKGKNGGFRLAAPPHKIFLADLIRIFQGGLKPSECFFKKRICPNRKTCKLKKKLDAIERYVSTELRSITVEDLLR